MVSGIFCKNLAQAMATQLDIYRASPDSKDTCATFKSLFNWGKDHYNIIGKAAGRDVGGGVNWGTTVKRNFNLWTKWQDAKTPTPASKPLPTTTAIKT